MNQFNRKGGPQEATTITSLAPDIGRYADKKALAMTCRLVWVQEKVHVTTKSKANGVFSAVIVGTDGIADVTVWDPEVIRPWQAAVGCMVTITGMSCARHGPASEKFAQAPGSWCFHLNKGCYTITVLKGVDDNAIPHNGKVPDAWLRPLTGTTDPQPDRSSSQLSIPTSNVGCCDAPGDRTCKATGKPHQAVCAVCGMRMNKAQPYCSKQDGERCAAQVGQTPPTSPFKQFEGCPFDASEGVPPPKAMKFTHDAETDPE